MFRLISKSDIPIIIKIRNKPETRNFLEIQEKFTVEQSYEWFDKTNPWWFVIEEENSIIGYIRTSNRKENSIWVGMDIDTPYRGKGYALKYYKEFFNYLKETTSIKEIFLEVFVYNIIAKSLYDKLGFVELSRRELPDGRFSIFMSKQLYDI